MNARAKNHTTSKFLVDALTPFVVLKNLAVETESTFHPDWVNDQSA
jgi:hypothetical protein